MSLLKRLFGKSSPAGASPPHTASGLDPKAKVYLVRAFLVALDSGLVIGIQREGEWYLPGGIVEGPGTPDGVPRGSHFEPLAQHLLSQTGLRLTGLSDAVGLGMFPAPDGVEATVLYVASATGEQTEGTQFSLDALPEFAKICAVTHDQIRNLCGRL